MKKEQKLSEKLLTAFADRGSKLNVSIIMDESEFGDDHVLIEGSRDDFMFLSHIFLEIAYGDVKNRQLSSKSAGRKHFSKSSKYGIYINVI